MPSVPKPERYSNEKNLQKIRELPCAVCSSTPADPDHVRTKGAGGGDNLSNLCPLCRDCHIKRHSIGAKAFYTQYRFVIQRFREEHNLPQLQTRFLLDS
jgi:5-methylcytosine-specific restriction endonuclease McrA